jgi:succinate dehydrogenase / fumarate reductase, cytochrome b subunit
VRLFIFDKEIMSAKNKDRRPISPHIGIYKPQITSVLSITHRITGFALYVGAILLVWWIVANIYGCGSCINSLITSSVGRIFLILWSLALFYHMLNGIRHLFWDMGKGFEIKTVNLTGILVVLSSLILTALSWYY